MNLRAISDLTRKLSELLDKDLHKAQESKLAVDYEGACKDANNRLIQCSRMLEEGNMPGAVQLANVNPPLMELIRALTWEDAGIWREYCNTKKHPSPPAFDGPAIKSLTQALINEDTIGPEHPLSKEFSSLMMKKQQEEAYRVLCVILEKDPNNQSYTSIKPQLEQYIIEQKTGQLAQFVSQKDTAQTLALMREIEDFPFAHLQEIDIWPRAKTLECYNWISEVDQCRQANDWKGTQERSQRIDQAQIEFPSVLIAPEYEQYLSQVRAWVQQEEMKWLTQLNLDEAVRNLGVFLSNRENDRLMHRRVKYRDLLSLQYDLGILWNDLESLEQPIEDSLIKRFREEEDALDYDIERALAARKWTYIAATAASVALCAFLAVCLVNFNSARTLRAKLEEYRKHRDINATEAALSDIEMRKLKELITPGFKQALTEAQTHIKEEKTRLTNVVERLAGLEKYRKKNPPFDETNLTDVFSLEQIQAELMEVAELVAKLPPKHIEINDEELSLFTNSWEEFLGTEMTNRHGRLKDILSEMRANQTNNLVFFSGPRTVERGVKAFDALETKWEELANIKVPYLQPTKTHGIQYGSYKISKGVFQGHLDEWNKSNDKLTGASQLNDLAQYIGTLDEIATNKITSSISKKAIAAIKSYNLDQKRIVTDLLAPEIFKKRNNFPDLINGFSLRAEAVNDPDFVTGMSDIINNESIHSHSLYIVDWRDGDDFAAFDVVYVQAKQLFKINNKVPVNMYIPREAQGAVQFRPTIYRQVQKEFPGLRAFRNDPDSQRLSLTSVVREANLENLWDLKERKWAGEILDCLDRLRKNMYRDGPYGREYSRRLLADRTKQYPKGNALLGAYLLYNVLDLVKKKDPESWGLEWCPLAQEDHAKLEGLNIGAMREGDWMSGIKQRTFNPIDGSGAPKLDLFFASTIGIREAATDHNQAPFGYVQEAKAYHKMIASAYDKGRGVRVVGHVDPLVPDVNQWTQPKVRADNKITEIWGYTVGGVGVVLQRAVGEVMFKKTRLNVLDYSPLFFLSHDRRILFNQFRRENKGRPVNGLPRAFSDLQGNIVSVPNN